MNIKFWIFLIISFLITNNLYAINSVSKQDDLWNGKNPILNHMNFLDPRINAFTKNLVMFQSLFGIDKVKIKGKNLNLIVKDFFFSLNLYFLRKLIIFK